MFTSAIVPLALAASALANVFITSPVASSTFPAGQNATIAWQDDGNAPSLAQFGLATFAIYAGNAIEQTLLQALASSVNVSEFSSLSFVPDASIGPNSGEYFIRVTSQSLNSPSAPQYPEEAFSALFSLSGMSGQFNSTVQAEINGQSTAPIGGTSTPSSGPTATGSSSPVVSTPLSVGSTGTATASSSSPSSSSSSGAAKPVMATGFVALVATLVGAALF